MYLKRVKIKNIKSIEELVIEFDEPYEGWHVLLGENGAGKSTILKAISLCLIGDKQAYALKQNFKKWISKGEKEAFFQIDLALDKEQDDRNIHRLLKIVRKTIDSEGNIISPNHELYVRYNFSKPKGWYSAAFGPFRRLGENNTKSVSNFSEGNLENHITLFDASYQLTGAIEWLMNLKFEALEEPQKDNYLNDIIEFLNQEDFLPHQVKITKINHEGVFFKDGENQDIDIHQLSDGYQSVLALTVEILRQITNAFDLKEVLKKDKEKYIVEATGVVLIDEVDVHLHPQWQAKIGEWFKRYFPKIQFIVSTHSPIICQSAEGASIWKIEHAKTGEKSYRVTGQDYKRLVYGNILDALSTDKFGITRTERSKKSNEMLDRLAELNMKSIKGLTTENEEAELKELKSILPSEK